MQKKTFIIMIIASFLAIFSCDNTSQNMTNEKTIETNSLITDNSLLQIEQGNDEIEAIELDGDTLLIISTNDFLYYPFGKYNSFEDFQLAYPITTEDDEYKVDSVNKVFKVISIKGKNNFVRFLENYETNKLEILEANINDDDVILKNGIRIGMNQKSFLQIFLTKIPKELEKVSVIELESGLTGIWHYYIFSNNQLERITLKTDYLID